MKRIGIVGVGGFAAHILRNILTLEGEGLARLAGAVIRNPARYPTVIERMRAEGRTIYSSLSEMLDGGRGVIDIVALPVGIPEHRDMAIQALEAGYPVVLEKPVAATVQEVDDIVAAERRSGRFCAIGYQHIHTPAIQALREEVETGRLGKIKRIKCYVLWPRGRSYYERNPWAGQVKAGERWVLDGPVTNACAHFIYNMLYLLSVESEGKATIASLRAELYRANDIPSYDTACLRARMGSGAELFMAVSHAVNELQNPVMEIEAENASATWTMDGAKATIRYKDGQERTVEAPAGCEPCAQVFRDAIAVAEGERPRPLVTPLDGRLQVLAVNLMFESNGGVTTIPENCREVVALDDGDQRVAVKGLEKIVRRAFAEFKLFSELAVPWAHPSPEAAGIGYAGFPCSPRLREYLKG